MNSRHLIDTAVFDISYDDRETAFDKQAEIADFARDQLMNIVDEAFDDVGDNAGVYRIPLLEIDLGDVPSHDYRYAMAKRLREQLDAFFAGLRNATGPDAATDGKLILNGNSELDQLFYYFQHGYLPWYSRVGESESLEKLLEGAIRSNPDKLKSFLKSAPQRTTVIERLVGQFSDRTRMKLLRMLSPDHYPSLHRYIGELRSLDRASDTSSSLFPAGVAPDVMLALITQYLIAAAVDGNRSQLSSEQLFQQALTDALINKLNISKDRIAKNLQQLMQSGKDVRHLKAVVSGLCDSLSAEAQEPAVGHDTANPERPHAQAQHDAGLRLSGPLDQSAPLVWAFVSGDWETVRSCWSAQYQQHGEAIVKTLRHIGQKQKLRHQLVDELPVEMLQQMLVLLEPEQYRLVRQFIESRGVSAARTKDEETLRADRKTLWAYSLGYLLVERGAGFSRKAYFASLARQARLAGEQGLVVLPTAIADDSRSPFESEKHLAAQSSFGTARSDDENMAAQKGEGTTEHLLECYTSYERLKEAVTGRRPDIEAMDRTLVTDIETLAADAPWLLLRLFRELQARTYSSLESPVNYPIAVLQRLVSSFITLTDRPNSSRRRELVAAMKVRADHCRNPGSFYLHVLQRLIKEESLDSAVLEQCASLVDNDDAGNDTSSVTECRHEPIEARSVERDTGKQPGTTQAEDFTDYHDLAGGEDADFAASLQRMLEQQPGALCEYVGSGLADIAFVERLARVRPERLQIELLALTGPAEYLQMLQCAEILSTACCDERIGIGSYKREYLKWEIIYTYIAETGCLFNRDGFVRHYVESLSAHAGYSDSRQFRALLSRQIQRNGLPSTGAVEQSILQALSSDAEAFRAPDAQVSTNEYVDSSYQRDSQVEEEVYISNAGIVLAAPYLPRLFETLGLTRNSAFRHHQAAERGVHMLQFLANGCVCSPEYQLVLNKLLCGVKTGRPIRREIELSAEEKRQLESLLLAMIQHWGALGNTSISGLREAFLQRNGRLQLNDNAWRLSVETKSFDMLLDQIPWAYSTIKFPWMQRVIYVQWR